MRNDYRNAKLHFQMTFSLPSTSCLRKLPITGVVDGTHIRIRALRPVSRKSRKLFGLEKPFLRLRPAYSVKLVFSYVVKGIKSKIITKFCASRRLRFEDTKRIMSPEMRPKSSGTFEKRAPEHEPEAYVNTKKFHSVNVQLVCDDNMVFTHVLAGWPGSVHDSRVTRNFKT